jgi:hypothetical protein
VSGHTKSDWHPHFIVIGAVKAATTWIQKQLQRHENVFLPDPEPHFFSQEFDKGPEFYRQFFAQRSPKQTVIGEKSADYLAHPLAADRIASMLPDVRLVLQLRDPVARAYSDYKMLYRRGTVKGPPEDYLLSPDSPQPRFLQDGLYGQHLERWLARFPGERILTFLYEDISADPRATVERVHAHIGVSPHFDEEAARRKENNSREEILPLPLRLSLGPLKRIVSPLRGNPAFEATRSLLARELRYPPLGRELEQQLRDFYLRDIEVLEGLIGRDLSAWKQCRLHEAA